MTTQKRQTPREKAAKTGIIAGFNKGHKVTRRARAVSRKARLGLPKKKLRAVKAIIAELVGATPLEKRVTELLRVGKEKRALKFCNKRLGNITAAKKKRTKVEDSLRAATKKK
jgi:large subunit ribosomal protein L36e